MEAVNLNQLTCADGGVYLLDGIPFSGFAIETLPDGTLQTEMSLMRGVRDGVTRRWHPNGQLESERTFRNGEPHGWHRTWHSDGTLEVEFAWTAGDRNRHAIEPGFPMTEPSETIYVYDTEGRQTAVIHG